MATGNTQQHTTAHGNTRQRAATHCNKRQRAATHYTTLHQTATRGNTLQQTTTRGNTLHHTAPADGCSIPKKKKLQRCSQYSSFIMTQKARDQKENTSNIHTL